MIAVILFLLFLLFLGGGVWGFFAFAFLDFWVFGQGGMNSNDDLER